MAVCDLGVYLRSRGHSTSVPSLAPTWTSQINRKHRHQEFLDAIHVVPGHEVICLSSDPLAARPADEHAAAVFVLLPQMNDLTP
jgi:hypothetical protein